MKVRTLPREEWDRARDTGAPWMPCVRDGDRSVVVVENEAGEIVGSLSVLRQTRLEGAYVAPQGKNGGVVRALLRGAMDVARQKYGDEWAFIDAMDQEIFSIVERLGGEALPGATCIVPIPKLPGPFPDEE